MILFQGEISDLMNNFREPFFLYFVLFSFGRQLHLFILLCSERESATDVPTLGVSLLYHDNSHFHFIYNGGTDLPESL